MNSRCLSPNRFCTFTDRIVFEAKGKRYAADASMTVYDSILPTKTPEFIGNVSIQRPRKSSVNPVGCSRYATPRAALFLGAFRATSDTPPTSLRGKKFLLTNEYDPFSDTR